MKTERVGVGAYAEFNLYHNTKIIERRGEDTAKKLGIKIREDCCWD